MSGAVPAGQRGLGDADLALALSQLDAFGYTVVPPRAAGTAGLVCPLVREIARASAEANGGRPPDFLTGRSHARFVGPAGQEIFDLRDRSEVFSRALRLPAVRALVAHLIPDGARLASVSATLKGPGSVPLLLHADQPLPGVAPALVCNATLLLSDFDPAAGGLCFVPGSHRALRQPTTAENFRTPGMSQREIVARLRAGEDLSSHPFREPPHVVPVVAPRGSLVVWHGNTWHGAYPRRAPGLRASLVLYFRRPGVAGPEPSERSGGA